MNDARTANQLEQALHQSILESIVEPDVIQAMDKIGWSETGTPSEPQVPDNPASTVAPDTHKPETTTPDNPVAAAPAVTPDPVTASPEGRIDWEALRDPNGLIIGKYKTEADAVRGVGHAVTMAKQAFSERDALQQRIRELETRTTLSTPTPVTTAPAPVAQLETDLDVVVNEIVQEGGLIDEATAPKLRAAVREEAKRVARELMTEADSVKAKDEAAWTEVGSYMQKNHPDSVNFTQEINVFIASDPTVQKTVATLLQSGDRVGATEYAWLRYNTARNAQVTAGVNADLARKEVQLEAADQVRREAVDAARRDAGVVTTIATGVHENPNTRSNEDEIAAAAAEMERTGLGDRWRSLVYGKYLQNPVFD